MVGKAKEKKNKMSKFKRKLLLRSIILIILIVVFFEMKEYHYLNSAQSEKTITFSPKPKEELEPYTKSLKEVDFKKFRNLMIVAHPDDESLWGGGHLAAGDYFVLCITNGNNKKGRPQEFSEAVKLLGNQGQILNHRDNYKNSLSAEEKKNIYADINYVIAQNNWKKIDTHNPMGEYGHSQHKMVSAYTTKAALENYQQTNLAYFGKYYYAPEEILEQALSQGKLSKEQIEMKQKALNVYIYGAKEYAPTQTNTTIFYSNIRNFENFISYERTVKEKYDFTKVLPD
ncbi:MAG: PIG-L family deacetylase [Mycoplasmatales bacterium]